MYDIEMQEPSPEFGECWAAAGTHLDRQVDGGIRFWLRTELTPPFLEHLSFRLGNQLFFVRLEDVEGHVESPGSTRGLLRRRRARATRWWSSRCGRAARGRRQRGCGRGLRPACGSCAPRQ